jgi:hypothetical protein
MAVRIASAEKPIVRTYEEQLRELLMHVSSGANLPSLIAKMKVVLRRDFPPPCVLPSPTGTVDFGGKVGNLVEFPGTGEVTSLNFTAGHYYTLSLIVNSQQSSEDGSLKLIQCAVLKQGLIDKLGKMGANRAHIQWRWSCVYWEFDLEQKGIADRGKAAEEIGKHRDELVKVFDLLMKLDGFTFTQKAKDRIEEIKKSLPQPKNPEIDCHPLPPLSDKEVAGAYAESAR